MSCEDGTAVTSRLPNYSTCPSYMQVGDVMFDLDNHEGISSYVSVLESIRLYDESKLFESRIVKDNPSEVAFVPSFTLKNTTSLAHFYSNQRKNRMLKLAINYDKTKAEMDKPFFRRIGVLKIDVNSEDVLKLFLKTCDSRIDTLEVLQTPAARKDIFKFREQLSRPLVSSVKKVLSNHSFELVCHRFQNIESMQVKNFAAMNNLFVERNSRIKNVSYVEDTYSSVITLTNSFVVTNNGVGQPLFCERITAHFAKEDLTITDDCKYLYVGGNMIEVEGVAYPELPGPLKDLLSQSKDDSKGADRIVVLLDTQANAVVTQPVRRQLGQTRQDIRVATTSKFIDIKIKKASLQIEVNSNSCHSLVGDMTNDKFLQFLKMLINGRGNMSSPKLVQALKLHIVEGLDFEVQKHEDACKLMEQVAPLLPAAVRRFGITMGPNSAFAASASEGADQAKATETLKSWVRRFPMMEVLMRNPKSEPQTSIYYAPFMSRCYQAEKPSAAQ